MGITCSGTSVDFGKEQKWNRAVVDRVRRGVDYLCRSNGITVVKGTARFESQNTVLVEPQGERITAGVIVIATGSSPSDLPVLRVDSNRILSSDDIFKMDALPAEMAIVGGGAIGVEIATAFASLGTKVTIIEILDQLLPGLDIELSSPVASSLKRLGVDLRLGIKVVQSSYKNENAVELTFEGGEKLAADRVLVAIGRKPNTDGMNLPSAGLTLDLKRHICNRRRNRSSVPCSQGHGSGLPRSRDSLWH
jgi:dihydrolipoamide dehydrogenase